MCKVHPNAPTGAGRWCLICRRARSKLRRQENALSVSAYRRAYYQKNKDDIRARAAVYRAKSQDKIKAARVRYAAENPQRIRRMNRAIRLTYVGWTIEAHDAALLTQGNKCAICTADFTATPYADHDHATGKARALLCKHCNLALGHMKDNPATLRTAADYIEKHRGDNR